MACYWLYRGTIDTLGLVAKKIVCHDCLTARAGPQTYTFPENGRQVAIRMIECNGGCADQKLTATGNLRNDGLDQGRRHSAKGFSTLSQCKPIVGEPP